MAKTGIAIYPIVYSQRRDYTALVALLKKYFQIELRLSISDSPL
jgi:hypothetical protein